MRIELRIEADSLEEIAHLLRPEAKSPRLEALDPSGSADAGEKGSPEAEPELPKPARRSRKSAAAKEDTPESTADQTDTPGPTATTDASPSDEPVTFEDVRAFASGLMDSGKADGRAIQAMLKEKFNVSAFGPLKEEQYPAVMAELENLAA
jgi:hypothetical protein